MKFFSSSRKQWMHQNRASHEEPEIPRARRKRLASNHACPAESICFHWLKNSFNWIPLSSCALGFNTSKRESPTSGQAEGPGVRSVGKEERGRGELQGGAPPSRAPRQGLHDRHQRHGLGYGERISASTFYQRGDRKHPHWIRPRDGSRIGNAPPVPLPCESRSIRHSPELFPLSCAEGVAAASAFMRAPPLCADIAESPGGRTHLEGLQTKPYGHSVSRGDPCAHSSVADDATGRRIPFAAPGALRAAMRGVRYALASLAHLSSYGTMSSRGEICGARNASTGTAGRSFL